MYACFKRNLTSEVKVAQLSGYVAENTAYHHGEASLHGTIVGMAQDFVGSNNINLLVPNGQFGTRLEGGDDAASVRYIFTYLSPVTRALFPVSDDSLLTYIEDDGQQIEPLFFCPIIPLLLVNGSRGIGTGWSTSIPPHDPRDVVRYLRAKLAGDINLPPINPYSRGFTGTFTRTKNGYDCFGRAVKKGDTTVVIEELPIGMWTGSYKSHLEKLLENGTINTFLENHTTTKVSFKIDMKQDKLEKMENAGLEASLKLSSSLRTTNMNAFDKHGKMVKFETPQDIIEEFFPVRKDMYQDRISVLQSESKYRALLLRNKARFVEKVLNGEINLLGGVPKSKTVSRLDELGFDSEIKLQNVRGDNALRRRRENSAHDLQRSEKPSEGNADFDYLLDMPMSSLTSEKAASLAEESKMKDKQLEKVRGTQVEELWQEDLDNLDPFLPNDGR